ncbi:MAG: DUF993 family protein [Planctomycetes bacterium]|nr:DUF993 family protein [Planctomycetota bacterium]
MLQPQSKSGASAARPSETPAGAARSGQVPRGERPLLRMCFLSVRAQRIGDEIDWEESAAEQRHLAELGLGLALGLDPTERAELGWERLHELVRRTGALALAQGLVACASCEPAGSAASIDAQLEAVVQQTNAIEEAGGVPLILPLVALSRRRCKEDEYVEVYRTLLARVSGPVLLDWTGPKLRPELLDYFPGKSFERVMALDPTKVRGARFALLDVAREVRLRRELLGRDQLLFTADRAHLARLLLGVNPGQTGAAAPQPARYVEFGGRALALGDFSHALVAGLEGRAEALAQALALLDAGDAEGFLERVSAG